MADKLFPGSKPGERRLYLVNTANGIIVYSGIMTSADAFINREWNIGLPDFLSAIPPATYDAVEIHCHGLPAEIRLKPFVDKNNVAQFGNLLKRVLKPTALIEVLACLVARFDIDRLVKYLEKSNVNAADLETIRPFFEQYTNFNKVRLKKEYDLSRGIRRDFYPASFKAMATPDLAWKTAIDLSIKYEGLYGQKEENGAKFCIELAKASGATVRSSWYSQAQDRTIEGEKAELIGDWEGFVFDYTGTGLKQVYFNPERPQANRPAYVASNLVPLMGAAGRQTLGASFPTGAPGVGGLTAHVAPTAAAPGSRGGQRAQIVAGTFRPGPARPGPGIGVV